MRLIGSNRPKVVDVKYLTGNMVYFDCREPVIEYTKRLKRPYYLICFRFRVLTT